MTKKLKIDLNEHQAGQHWLSLTPEQKAEQQKRYEAAQQTTKQGNGNASARVPSEPSGS